MPIWLAAVLALLLAVVSTAVVDRRFRATLAGFFPTIAIWMQFALVKALPAIAGLAAEVLLAAFQSTQATFTRVVATLMTEISGREVPPEVLAGSSSKDSLIAFGETLGRVYVPELAAIIAPAEALSPQQARLAVEKAIGISTSFALDDWWDHTMIELTSLGQISWAADLSNAIARGFGFDALGKLSMRTLFRLAITDPLQIYFNRTYTPTLLTTGQAIDAWQKGLLDDQGVLEVLRDRGLSYDRATLLLNQQQKDFTTGEAEQLWRLGAIDEGTLDRIIRRQGYGDQRADLVGRLVRGRRQLTLLEEIADVGRRLYRTGDLTEVQLRELLGDARYQGAEIDLAVLREEIARREERQLTKGEILEAFREGILEPPDARDRMRRLQYGDDEIDILLATQQKALTPAQIIDALSRGLIDEARARTQLRATGYRDEDIDVLLDLRVRRLSPGQILDLLERGLIQLTIARAQLLALGFSEEVADLLLAFQARTLSPADVQAALLRGLITEGEATFRLRQLGYTEEDARLVLTLRFQLLSSGQILDAYETGLVTRTSALSRLQQLGFTDEAAELVVAVFEVRQAERLRRPPPS